MNTPRLIVLGIAAVAAGGAAFLARGLLGGGTSNVSASQAPQATTSQVLVAASDMVPGQKVLPEDVRWQKWPSSSVDASFITSTTEPNVEAAVKGTVARTPIIAGEPLTGTKIVHADTAGFMSATLTPGMRAVSIAVSVASVAGGFILSNDRVDLVLTTQISDQPRRFRSSTFLRDVRVLAIDQAADNKSQKAVSDVKTATLELTPEQAEKVTRAQATGLISLSLRSLVTQSAEAGQQRVDAARTRFGKGENSTTDSNVEISVIRYGVPRADTSARGE